MGSKAIVFGLMLMLGAVAAFLNNMSIYHFAIIGDWTWFWNPVSYFFGSKVGTNIWLIGGAISKGIAFVYSAVLFVIGAFAILK